MREIKFRGRTEIEWVYGSLVVDTTPDKKTFIIDYAVSDTNTYTWSEVEPETVGQTIGLSDKNKKEIYEGDVIKTSWEGNKEVVFRKGCFCYQTGGDKYHIFNEKKVEVIGNIYENKDLLKAELSEGELI